MKNYLELDFKTATFYSYSSAAKEDYEPYTSSTGTISYRKYFKKGIYGKIKTMYIKADDRFGLQVRIILENGSEWFMLKFPIKSSQGRLDSYMESLASYLPNLQLDTPYRIFPYVMDIKTENGKELTQRGVSIVEAELNGSGQGTPGAKVEKALKYLKRDEVYGLEAQKNSSIIPKLEFKAGLAGKFMPTASSLALKTEFFEDLIQREVSRLDMQPEEEQTDVATPPTSPSTSPPTSPQSSTSTTPSAQEDKFKNAKVGVEIEVDEDDLPF